jgi:hypothetical protein
MAESSLRKVEIVTLEELKPNKILRGPLLPEPGQVVTGPLFNEPMRVETVHPNGNETCVLGLVGVQSERFRRVTITPQQLSSLTVLKATKSFDGDGSLLRLGLNAYATITNGTPGWSTSRPPRSGMQTRKSAEPAHKPGNSETPGIPGAANAPPVAISSIDRQRVGNVRVLISRNRSNRRLRFGKNDFRPQNHVTSPPLALISVH